MELVVLFRCFSECALLITILLKKSQIKLCMFREEYLPNRKWNQFTP